ncbi:hypothetical protein HYH03_016270 [Edaphochlamys debaryana]|uniref:Uncharacterized protein n=1 Tax=Edaphochlamys debaryana TaxID=47281 RepID=A0A836BRL8_9CHLO|nr:hypothetical protein HYH03_016270 [Edaphochlamys debaryana]|eukprot:KAG2484974.1 hypothetical protein HYH03_016270 [Edaphochlamys debaryana]
MIQAMKNKAVERSQELRDAGREHRSQSVPRATHERLSDSGRIRQPRPQLPLRRPEKPDPEELNRNLAAKLQPLEAVAGSILASVEERKGGPVLAKGMAKDFVVGRATCASAAVVSLYGDRMEYKFSHASQGRIDMCMYTKDLVAPELDARSLALRFRIAKPLRHFIDAYDCTDPGHRLVITFTEKADASAFATALQGACKVALQVVGGEL